MRSRAPWWGFVTTMVLVLGLGNLAQGQEEPPAAAPAAEAAPAEPAPADTAAAPAAPVEIPAYNQGDVTWMLVSSAFVLLMTAPGLFLFYGGLVRRKNVLSVFMQCLALCGINSVLWVVIGYSLAFSDQGPTMIVFKDDKGEVLKDCSCIGGTENMLLKNSMPTIATDASGAEVSFLPPCPLYANVPDLLFMVFQMMFFIITPALICGAFAERMKFSAMVVFTILWGLIVYIPLAHWVWGPRSLFGGGSPMQSLDFAGGLVVHASSGISALVCALFLGKRVGYGKEPIVPHNLTMTATGAALLWFGWFGFNAGSAISAGNGAVNAFVVTHVAAAAALIGWSVAEWLMIGKPTVLGASSGIVAGLVVITPASGFVTTTSAMIMGAIAGVVCFAACAKLKPLLGYDDALDAFGVHGIGGMLGAVLTGVFVDKAASLANAVTIPDGVLMNQVVSVGITAVLSIVATTVILSLISVTIGLRVSEESEIEGLDSTQHSESGYVF